MSRWLRFILRLLLVAAFVPVLAAGLLRPTPLLLVVFGLLVLLAWASLRLASSRRWQGAGLALALAACAGVWSLTIAAGRVGTASVIVP